MYNNEFDKFLKEAAQVAVKSGQHIGSYIAPAGADEILSKKSTDEGLDDIVAKITGGFAGDASAGKDPGKPSNPGEYVKGNAPGSLKDIAKGEYEIGIDPKNPASSKKTVPMENDLFDANESIILQKLIEEIEKSETSILDEMTADEFDDSETDLEDLDIDLLEMDDVDFDDLDDDADLDLNDPDYE